MLPLIDAVSGVGARLICMTTIQHGTPGGSLDETGSKYGYAGEVGARFERRVAAALEEWLSRRPEPVHVFHDLSGLATTAPTGGRTLNLGTTNIDHVILTGRGWIMLDAKGVSPGQLRVEHDQGVLLTPDGQRRPQPWLDDGRAYSRAGCLFDLTRGKAGVMAWVVPDEVDYTHPSVRTAGCFRENSLLLTLSELAHGALEQISDLLPVPYRPADPRDIAALQKLTTQPHSEPH